MNTLQKTRLFLLIPALLLLTACGSKKKDAYPTLQTDSVLLETTLPVGKDSGNGSCFISIRYEFVKQAENETAKEEINRKLIRELLGTDYEGSEIRQALDSFKTDYERRYHLEMKQLRTFEPDFGTLSHLMHNYSILLENRLENEAYGIASFHCYVTEKTGNPATNVTTRILNFDTRTGTHLTLDKLFAEGYEEKINELLIESLLKANKVGSVKELEDLGYFTSSSIYPSENFYLRANKIAFLYNPYDGIGPYDMQQASIIEIDLEDLSMLIGQDSPLHRIID